MHMKLFRYHLLMNNFFHSNSFLQISKKKLKVYKNLEIIIRKTKFIIIIMTNSCIW